MSEPSSTTFDIGSSGVLPFLAAVVTGLLGFFGAQFTGVVRLQKTLLDASRQWVEHTQTQHARDIARILELESEILRQRGVINQILQREQSLIHILSRSGIEIPGDYGHALERRR